MAFISSATAATADIAVTTAKKVNKMFNDGGTPHDAARKLVTLYQDSATFSLPERLSATRLEPYVLIDSNLTIVDPVLVRSLLQMLLTRYCHYYLQAVQLELAAGAGSEIINVLERYATNPSMANALVKSNIFKDVSKSVTAALAIGAAHIGTESKSTEYLSLDSLDDGSPELPTNWGTYVEKPEVDLGLEAVTVKKGKSQKLEADGSVSTTYTDETITTPDDPPGYSGPGRLDKDIFKRITDDSSLAVGKMLDLTVSFDGNLITIPIQATLVPKLIDPMDLVSTSKYTSVDQSLKARYHALRAGQISFWKDFLFAQDLIKMDRKALFADKTGLLNTRSQATKAIVAGMVSGRGSPNAISAMQIISEETAAMVGKAIRGDLHKAGDRNRFFAGNVLMGLVIVNTTMQRFTIYERGKSDGASFTLDEIKTVKSQGNDLEATLKAYRLGSSTSLYS